MKKLLLLVMFALPVVALGQSAQPATLVQQTPTRLDGSQCQTTASGTAQQTITITPPLGQYVYMTLIQSNAAATTAPAASFITTTSTNFSWTGFFGLTATAGVSGSSVFQPATPVKSNAPTTAVTVVSNAAVTSVNYSMTACYYFAP